MAPGLYHKFHQRILGWPRWVRLFTGVVLILGGLLGFLPILGFWMVPLGLLVLSVDIPVVRRFRRRLELWWARRREARQRREAPERTGAGRD